jgi:hypothetical protein
MRQATSKMEQPWVPEVAKTVVVAVATLAEVQAAVTSNVVPPTADRSAELQGTEARDEMLLRAQTTALADPIAAQDAIDLDPGPDEHPEPHPSAGYLAVEGASADSKALTSRPQLWRFSAAMHRRSAIPFPVLRPEYLPH